VKPSGVPLSGTTAEPSAKPSEELILKTVNEDEEDNVKRLARAAGRNDCNITVKLQKIERGTISQSQGQRCPVGTLIHPIRVTYSSVFLGLEQTRSTPYYFYQNEFGDWRHYEGPDASWEVKRTFSDTKDSMKPTGPGWEVDWDSMKMVDKVDTRAVWVYSKSKAYMIGFSAPEGIIYAALRPDGRGSPCCEKFGPDMRYMPPEKAGKYVSWCEKIIEWSETAISNNVTSFSKDIPSDVGGGKFKVDGKGNPSGEDWGEYGSDDGTGRYRCLSYNDARFVLSVLKSPDRVADLMKKWSQAHEAKESRAKKVDEQFK